MKDESFALPPGPCHPGVTAPGIAYATPVREAPLEAKLEPSLRRAISQAAPEASLSVVVSLRERAELTHLPRRRAVRSQEVIRRLEEVADRSQAELRTQLGSWRRTGGVRRFTPYWIFNGIGVDATPAVVAAIAARPEVLRVTLDYADVTLADATLQPNVIARTPLPFGTRGSTAKGWSSPTSIPG